MEYKDQWMIEDIPTEDLISDPNLSILKNLFFEKRINHSYSTLRLFWLFRWLQEMSLVDVTNYQNDPMEYYSSNKKIKLLLELWDKGYFHPFITTSDACEIVSNDKDKYVIGLSSTRPDSIRITYWRDGVKHHRIDLHTYTTKESTEIIDYDLIKLEFVIQKFIQMNSLSKISCDYGS